MHKYARCLCPSGCRMLTTIVCVVAPGLLRGVELRGKMYVPCARVWGGVLWALAHTRAPGTPIRFVSCRSARAWRVVCCTRRCQVAAPTGGGASDRTTSVGGYRTGCPSSSAQGTLHW